MYLIQLVGDDGQQIAFVLTHHPNSDFPLVIGFSHFSQGVIFGQLTPEEAAKNMQDKLTQELQNALGG